ncbi:MAG: CsbD family protein [Xanthobacteraceae bacterium]|jgi:uncharacterized protein YjbJ (UPF0337 family)|nr:CsbD family protein [Xanthobacteraceae bacterium]
MDKHRITGAARHMGGRLREIAGGAGDEAARRAEGAYDEALGYGARTLSQARDQARYLADDAYETGQRLYGQGMTTLSRQAGAHPLAMVFAAGLAGAAIAWLLMGNNNSRR